MKYSMRSRHLIFMAFLIFSCVSCSRHSDVQKHVTTFAKLPGIISPFIEYMPVGAISDTEASSMAHYKVAYDEQDRINEISFYRGSVPSNNAYYRTHRVKYQYLPEKIVRTYFNTMGKKSVMWRHYYNGNQVHKEEFLLDSQGNKTKLYLYDSLDNRIESEMGSFEFSIERIDSLSFIQKQFKKNGEPQVLTEYFPFTTTLIKLDSLGFLYSITNVDPATKMITLHDAAGYAEVIFDFDKYGNELGWWFLDTKGKLANRKAFNEIGGYGYARWSYEMDWIDQSLGLANGFIERYYNDDDEPVNNNFGVHEVRYTHTVWGDVSTIYCFSKMGDKVFDQAYGYFGATFEYDELGKRINTKKYDVNEKLIED